MAGPRCLFRNEGGNGNHSLRIKLVGTQSNRDGIGTIGHCEGRTATGKRRCCAAARATCRRANWCLTFGLGKAGQADEIELRWPSGQVDKLSKVAAGQTITVKEGSGIVQQRPFGAVPAPAAATPVKANAR